MDAERKSRLHTTWKKVLEDRQYYYMLLIPVAYLIVFKFVPMYGVVIAFKNFNIFNGSDAFDAILKSEWVGLKNFENIFSRSEFVSALFNTLLISVYKIIFLFPLPIFVAILLNELRSRKLKKSVQTVIYIPHFLSWVIVGSMFFSILNADGMVNQLVSSLGMEKISFFMDTSLFRGLLIFSAGWKETGWGTIIYLAAITSIDPSLYEAATIDGAGRWTKMAHITLPGISFTIVFMLILKIGNLLSADFEQILVMYNPMVYSVADVIPTYIYRVGMGQMDFTLGTTVGLFNSITSFILIFSASLASKKLVGRSIW